MDPRVIRTKNIIIEAFLDLIKHSSFETITVKDITEKATVNRATFYRHFPDKYALLDEICNRSMKYKGFEKLKEKSILDQETFPLLIEAFYNLIKEFKAMFRHHFSSIILILDQNVKQQLIEVIYSLLPIGKEETRRTVAIMILMSMHSATCDWVDQQTTSKEEFFQTLNTYLHAAIKPFIH